MRVALICPYAWDDPGGVQTHIRELAESLLARDHAVTVIAPVRHGAAQPWVSPVGRPIDIPYNASNAPIDPRPWSMKQVRETLRRFEPDVVHAHEPLTPSTSMWATLGASVPVVATFHSGASRSRLYDATAPVLRRIARRISIRVAVSEAAAAFAGSRIGGAFEIVPNGVDVSRFADAEPADLGAGTKLLFVGRLDERKGFPTAVEAFSKLAAERPDLRLVVVGDGPDRSALDRLAPSVRSRVTMLGPVPNIDLPPFHAACDLYLGPSVGGESFGVVLIEAMAAGLPVVASDIAGYREVDPRRDGRPAGPARRRGGARRRGRADPRRRATRRTPVGRGPGAGIDLRLVGGQPHGWRRSTNGRPPGRRRRYDRRMSPVLWIVVGLLAVVLLAGIYLFNRLVSLRTRVNNGWSQIDVQLRRRYDLIPNLVETVKGYASHEREVFEHVTEARAGAMAAEGVDQQAQAENAITGDLRQLFAVVENYPELKANENFLALQEELTGTESKIAYARQFYNDQVMKLNTLVGSFPSNLVAKAFGFTTREFFDIDDPERGPVRVDLTPDA